MGVLQVGQTEIIYRLDRKAGRERKVVVTPEGVQVLAPPSDSEAEIAAFLNRKRQWIFNATREIEAAVAGRAVVPRIASGSRIPYRGRRVALRVVRTDAIKPEVTYRNGFTVTLPDAVSPQIAEDIVRLELKTWLMSAIRADVKTMAGDYAQRFQLHPRSVRVTELRRAWGTCGPSGSISINWQLVFAPRRVLEYAVAHELAHLRHRNHGAEFWKLLGKMYPDHERARGWLENHQGSLSDGFLSYS